MPGDPTRVGQNTSQTNAQTSIATSAGCIIPNNSLVVVIITNCNAASATVAPTAIDENADGTGLFGATPDIGVALAGNNGYVSIWSAYYTNGVTKTFRAKFGSANYTVIEVYVIPGMASSNWVDQIGTANSGGGSTSLNTTTVGNVSQNDEVAFHVASYAASTVPSVWPEVSPIAFTDGYPSNYHNATRTHSLKVQWKNGLTPGAQLTAVGTMAASVQSGRILVTYKAAPVLESDNFFPFI